MIRAGQPRGGGAALAAAAAAAVLAAALYTLACPPYEWSLLAWAAPALLLVPARRLGTVAALACGALFGVAIGFGITGWAYHAALEYFAFDRARTAAFVLAVWLFYSGLPCALLCAAWAALARRLPDWMRGPVGAWLWVLMEWLRSTLGTGMPWELLGHTQFRHLGLIQIADLGGVYALSWVMALVSVAGGELVAGWRGAGPAWRRLVLPATVLLATALYGADARGRWDAMPDAGAVRTVAVVQGNIPNAFRWKQAFFERMLATYAGLTGAARGEPPDVIVWPENAANFYLNREPMLLGELAPSAAAAREGLVVGGPRLTDGGEARNAAYLIGPRGAILGTYDKQRLVPLAEYDPRRRAEAARASEPVYTAGPGGELLRTAATRLGAVICYEVLFPGLVRDQVRRGAEILVNLSNDSWLDGGDGAAPRQHFSMAVFRAVETRRFLVRAAATGVSGFVSPAGEIYASLAAGTAGTSVARVAIRHGETAYVRWGERWIPLAGLGLGLAALAERRRTAR
jgi:apolipoprotein N-acyltransferase